MDTKIEYKDLPKDSELLPVIESVRKFALVSLSTKRYEHSMRVAQTAQKMCYLYDADPCEGFLAGIGHDICKEMPPELILSFAKRDGQPITKIEKEKISLLHGRAAAVKLHDDFAITNKDILFGVANHTFGSSKLGKIGKIVFIADKIEPGREHVTPEYLEKMFSYDLDELVKIVVKENVDYLISKGRKVAPQTMEFLKFLNKKAKKNKL